MSRNFIDINTIKPYRAFSDKDYNCYKFTHLIKIQNKSPNDNVIIVNDNKSSEFMPVLTLSTNTDYGRDLKRDSFAILKFIEDNDIINNCVEIDSEDEKFVHSIRGLPRYQILKKTILELAKESSKLNNLKINSNIRHNELKNNIHKNINNIIKKELNVEIYEFLLKNYSDSIRNYPIFTTSIESSPNNECSFINLDDSNNIFKKSEKIRTCDPIKGNLHSLAIYNSNKEKYEMKTVVDDLTFNFNIRFNSTYINSDLLIRFGSFFGAKENPRRKVNQKDPIYPYYIKSEFDTFIDNTQKIFEPLWGEILLTSTPESKHYNIPTNDDKSLIIIIRPSINDKFIIFGDFHGSYQTFIRHLLRLRKMGVLDQESNLINNYHLVFLGDIIDRGVYGYEIIMLIYALLQINPQNVHITRGNHEEKVVNEDGPNSLKAQLDVQFGKDSDDIFNKINYTMSLQPSALLIQNPINLKYIYLSHGGIPTSIYYDINLKKDQEAETGKKIHPNSEQLFTIIPLEINKKFKNFNTILSSNIIINNNEISLNKYDFLNDKFKLENNTIRWNDLAREIHTSKDSKNSYPSIGRGIWVGSDLLKEAQSLGIELFIRGHNDTKYNTKLLPI
jgi:hypothetical protein